MLADSCTKRYVERGTAERRTEDCTEFYVALEFDCGSRRTVSDERCGGREYLFCAVLEFDEQDIVLRNRVERTVGIVPKAVRDVVGRDFRYFRLYLFGVLFGDNVLCLST